jgi:hypothetical protein
MKHRFRHLLDIDEKAAVDTETIGIDQVQEIFDKLEEEKLSFDDGFDNFDNDDNDDGDDDGDDDDDEAYLRDKLDVAEDEASIISESRVIFQKDPNTGKTLMICRIDEMSVPKEYLNGKTMFAADVIFRSFREYSHPKKKISKIDSTIFKKKNWKKKQD